MKRMQITWFGHSCFRIDTGSSRILIDPFLTGNATFEKAAIPLLKAIEGVTHVALTHGHEDHAGDTVHICKERELSSSPYTSSRPISQAMGWRRSMAGIPAARSITTIST